MYKFTEQSKNECVGENNTPTNDGASEAQMKEGTVKYRDAFRWPDWETPVVNYRLSKDGVLTVVCKNSSMHANPAPDAAETMHYDEGQYYHSTWSRYESPFADLEFHTAILEDGFDCIEAGFFSGCKGLKKIILTDSIKQIRPHFADNSPVEYLNEGGLLYLGTADNPHYFLVGCADDYDCENLVIPEGTVYVSDGAFDGKTCIRGEISFPASLVRLGENAFRGTSVKHLYIPDNAFGNNVGNWCTAFQNRYYDFYGDLHTDNTPLLESISVPYGCYEAYLKCDGRCGDWWHGFVNCAITFRSPDGTTAEVLPADPTPKFFDEDLDEYDEYDDEEEDTHIRYIDTRGNFISEEVFDNHRSAEFQDGIAVVCKEGKYGIIDTSGKWVIEPQFDGLSSFQDGIAIAHKDGKCGYVDRSGAYVIPAAFDYAWEFREGLAAVGDGNLVGFIDRTGQIVVEPQFEEVQDFHEGMAAVMVNGKWGFIDCTGKVVVEPIYHEVSRFNRGIAQVRMWGKFGYVRKDGSFLFEPIFDSAPCEAESVMVVRVDEGKVRKYGMIDCDGNVLLEPQSDFRIFDFYGDIARIAAKTEHGDEKWGYINIEGKVVVEPKYDDARHFSEGIGVVALGGRYGLVDRDGREIVVPKFDMIGRFHNGMADVEIAKRYGYIDREGKIVIEPKFDSVRYFYRGYATVYVNRKAGVINTKGEYVVEPVYDDVNFYGDAYIRVKSDGRWGVVDINGNTVIEPQFKEISSFHDGVARVKIGPVELPSPVCDDDHVGKVTPEFDPAHESGGELDNKGDNNFNDLPF